MKLTTRGRYAVTAVLDMALHASATPVTLAEIGNRHNISRLYLEKLFAQLRAGGLVRGTRGSAGGYVLARPAEHISVADVLDVLDNMDATNCGGLKNCASGSTCLTHGLWERLNTSVSELLHGISLQQLADEARGGAAAHKSPVADQQILARGYA